MRTSPWFKVDDGFHGHPKVVDLSLAAVGLWTVAGSWCASYLTDGDLPSRTVLRLGGSDVEAAELVGAGLWLETDEGYRFKDWADYQPSKDQVEAERAASRERVQKWRSKKKGVTADEPRTNDVGNGVTNAVSNGERTPEVHLPRPLPLPLPNPLPNPSSSDEELKSEEGALAPVRDDVTRLLDLLDEELRKNGSKVPARTKKNVDAARLMLDRDGRTEEQIATAIRWCQADEFWRSNILSMSKLREKFDTLRQQAARNRAPANRESAMDRNLRLLRERMEDGSGRTGSGSAADQSVGGGQPNRLALGGG